MMMMRMVVLGFLMVFNGSFEDLMVLMVSMNVYVTPHVQTH